MLMPRQFMVPQFLLFTVISLFNIGKQGLACHSNPSNPVALSLLVTYQCPAHNPDPTSTQA